MPTPAAADLVLAYLQALKAKHSSASSQRQARCVLARLFSHLGITDPRQVEESHLAGFARSLREANTRSKPLARTTQAMYLQRVRSFFCFLAERGHILKDPAADLSQPHYAPLPRLVLSERQAERLMNAPSSGSDVGKRDRALLETFYGTGIRRSECARLEVSDLDLAQGTLLVRNGKGRKDRVVPLPHRAALALDAYLREVRPELVTRSSEPALFLTAWHGRRLSPLAIAEVVIKHAKTAKLPHLYPHVLRHTCATHLLRGGADVRHVQLILGHRSLDTTMLYTRVRVEDLVQVVKRCHPRERRRRRSGRARR